MAEAAAMELAVSSGLVGGVSQLAKSGAGKITRWVDRAKGLKLLKNLPKGPLEAFVFGEDDVTPELLAALSLGGTPGLQLSTIALLKAGVLGDMQGGERFLSEDSPPKYMDEIRDTEVSDSSLMDGVFHSFDLLYSRPSRTQMRVHLPGDDHSVGTVSTVTVIAIANFFAGCTRGLVVRSQGKYYYCENRWGELELSDIDVPITPIDVDRYGFDSSMFVVSPTVLKEYSCFHRLCNILGQGHGWIVKLLGLARVAKELGEEFRTQTAGDGIPLLSKQHLRAVHNNPRRCTPTLRMPTGEELRTRVEEATARLPLYDRDAGLVLFRTMHKLISDFVKTIKSEAAGPGNVGVRPYENQLEFKLIQSCIVQTVGMDATFAIFDGFRKHQLNIAVSPGCTAIYFPGLSLTVAFPEGHEVQSRRVVLRPACPFTSDFQESLPILLDLAPKLAKNIFAQFAKMLSSELAKDPALALSPVTEAIVRELSPRDRSCDALYLTDLFGYLKKRNPARGWGEASVAGILCQLGMTFSIPPGREGCGVEDFRCFQVCREVWPSTCLGAELFVDCGVDVSGCEVSKVYVVKERSRTFLLKTLGNLERGPHYELTDVPWDKLDELRGCCGLLRPSTEDLFFNEGVRIPVPCRVIGFDSAPVKTWSVATVRDYLMVRHN